MYSTPRTLSSINTLYNKQPQTRTFIPPLYSIYSHRNSRSIAGDHERESERAPNITSSCRKTGKLYSRKITHLSQNPYTVGESPHHAILSLHTCIHAAAKIALYRLVRGSGQLSLLKNSRSSAGLLLWKYTKPMKYSETFGHVHQSSVLYYA